MSGHHVNFADNKNSSWTHLEGDALLEIHTLDPGQPNRASAPTSVGRDDGPWLDHWLK